jgi:hypothetical protein
MLISKSPIRSMRASMNSSATAIYVDAGGNKSRPSYGSLWFMSQTQEAGHSEGRNDHE